MTCCIFPKKFLCSSKIISISYDILYSTYIFRFLPEYPITSLKKRSCVLRNYSTWPPPSPSWSIPFSYLYQMKISTLWTYYEQESLHFKNSIDLDNSSLGGEGYFALTGAQEMLIWIILNSQSTFISSSDLYYIALSLACSVKWHFWARRLPVCFWVLQTYTNKVNMQKKPS